MPTGANSPDPDPDPDPDPNPNPNLNPNPNQGARPHGPVHLEREYLQHVLHRRVPPHAPPPWTLRRESHPHLCASMLSPVPSLSPPPLPLPPRLSAARGDTTPLPPDPDPPGRAPVLRLYSYFVSPSLGARRQAERVPLPRRHLLSACAGALAQALRGDRRRSAAASQVPPLSSAPAQPLLLPGGSGRLSLLPGREARHLARSHTASGLERAACEAADSTAF